MSTQQVLPATAWAHVGGGHIFLQSEGALAYKQKLYSPGGMYYLMCSERGLALYKSDSPYQQTLPNQQNSISQQEGSCYWASKLNSNNNDSENIFENCYLLLQNDGKLALFNQQNRIIWEVQQQASSQKFQSSSSSPYYLGLQFDGDLTLQAPDGSTLWRASQTAEYRAHQISYLCEPKFVDRLFNGCELKNEQLIWSQNGWFFLKQQQDGNAVVYQVSQRPFLDRSAKPIWASNTNSGANQNTQFSLTLQTDGNLVLKADQKILWKNDRNAYGAAPYTLVMQGDGNLVQYDANKTPIWMSNSAQRGFQHFQDTKFYLERSESLYDRGLESDKQLSNANVRIFVGQISQERKFGERAMLFSSKGNYLFVMHSNGNAAVYRAAKAFDSTAYDSKQPLWVSNTQGKGQAGYSFIVQGDGNACIYDGKGQPIWSNSAWGQGRAPYILTLQDEDGRLQQKDSQNTVVWTS